jgi:response regulator RpfG family c-di-GMP phosphodiesterase/serine/threonine protein kinase
MAQGGSPLSPALREKTDTLYLAPAVQGRERSALDDFVKASYVLLEDIEKLSFDIRNELFTSRELQPLLALLVKHQLLTQYQADRIEAGRTTGLILGNYRVLHRLGAGGMGIVFQAEHLVLRRSVAIKVLSLPLDTEPLILQRFTNEMRIVAQLQHPNIVSAIDAGVCNSPDPDCPMLRYFVMEYVPGQDLEVMVEKRGPLPPTEACDLAYQIAAALAEAQKQNLVHRDIKPSNVLVTADGQAKLLDFGLARHLPSRVTEPGTILGTFNFMAPEQAHDASTVDIRADIYGLGATLYWCLAGRAPFEFTGNFTQDMVARMTQPPPSIRCQRLDVPVELDELLARMMAPKPDNRFSSPQAVMRALLPFLRTDLRDHLLLAPSRELSEHRARLSEPQGIAGRRHEVLVVDDDSQVREFCRFMLQAADIQVAEAPGGFEALEMIATRPFDLVLLDIDMPGLTGRDVCRKLREAPPCPNLKIIMFSGRASGEEMAQIMLAGADDFLTKPVSIVQMQARVKAALRLKDAQDRADALSKHLLAVNYELEHNLQARDSDLIHARNALVLALAELVGYREAESGSHLTRMQRYCRCLAEALAGEPSVGATIDFNFVQMLECCVPLHDIGKAALPDHILAKPGKLSQEERFVMQTHTTIGAETLEKVARKHGFAQAFLQMAVDIARHHHERWDGAGYPDRLAGSDIPLAARIVAVADVYDALRSRRVYKPALSHTTALRMMTEEFTGHFDPALLQTLQRVAPQFEKIFRDVAD